MQITENFKAKAFDICYLTMVCVFILAKDIMYIHSQMVNLDRQSEEFK